MEDYKFKIVDARFVAAGVAQQAAAYLHFFKPDAGRHRDDDSDDYGFSSKGNTMPSASHDAKNPMSLAEDEWNKNEDYWLGRYTLTDLVVKVSDKGLLLINDATINISKQKIIEKTALVGSTKGTVKEFIYSGDYQISITVGVVAVNSNNEEIDQYPEKAMSLLREVLEVDEALEVSSAFLDIFDVNRIVITDFSAKQMTYSNRQVLEITALSDFDYIIQSTDY